MTAPGADPVPASPLPGVRRGDLVLERTAAELTSRFAGMFNPETVRRFVFESYTALADGARIRTYLPVLVGRFAADRLTALAQAQGMIGKPVPVVLFICTANAARSQLAAALLERHAAGRVQVRSAGTHPAGQVDPGIAEVLVSRGISMADAYPKPLTDEVIQAADVIVTLGCGEACPVYPGKRYLDWPLPDPAGIPREQLEPIVDDVDRRVAGLLQDLSGAP